MLLTLSLPRITAYADTATVEVIYADVGAVLGLGAKLLDLSLDLGALAPHDCPPVSRYRIALRDRVWLRRLEVAPGDEVAVGAILAHFSTERDDPLGAEPARAVRVTIAGIASATEWWRGDRA